MRSSWSDDAHDVDFAEDVKVVEALLVTMKVPELPPNFTFAVMAEVRGMPSPKCARSFHWWYAAAAYLVAAWIAIVAFAAIGDRALLATALLPVTGVAHAGGSVVNAIAHVFTSNAVFIAPAVALVLAIDMLAMAGVFYFYRFVRPRLAAVVARDAN